MNENHYIGLVVQPYREGFTSHEVTKQSKSQLVVASEV